VNLVNELQISAERDDVLTVLRKTTRLASKLGRTDIADWLLAEQNGYPRGDAVPDYRRVRGRLAMNVSGYVPAGFGRIMSGVQELPGVNCNPELPMMDSISTVLTLIAGMDDGSHLSLPIERNTEMDRYYRKFIDPMFSSQISFILNMNPAQVRAIPERIKDKVLEWACALERAGVSGDGLTYSVEDRKIAQSVTFNIYGSQIGQLSNSGTNHTVK